MSNTPSVSTTPLIAIKSTASSNMPERAEILPLSSISPPSPRILTASLLAKLPPPVTELPDRSSEPSAWIEPFCNNRPPATNRAALPKLILARWSKSPALFSSAIPIDNIEPEVCRLWLASTRSCPPLCKLLAAPKSRSRPTIAAPPMPTRRPFEEMSTADTARRPAASSVPLFPIRLVAVSVRLPRAYTEPLMLTEVPDISETALPLMAPCCTKSLLVTTAISPAATVCEAAPVVNDAADRVSAPSAENVPSSVAAPPVVSVASAFETALPRRIRLVPDSARLPPA